MTQSAVNKNHSKHPEAFKMINDLSFCVFDLETTGGNHKHDKIIEIGLVKIKNLEVVEKKNYLIQPEMKIPDFIKKLTSISDEDVKDAPLIEDVVDKILEFMGDSILVAHNTSFDIPFFNSVLRRMNRPELENNSLCTNLMTKYLIPDLLNSNLNYMSKIFSIDHHKAHRALDDALATAELLQRYLEVFIQKDIHKINHLYYPRNRYELDRIHFKEGTNPQDVLDQLADLKSPSLFSLKGENGIILYALPCTNSEKERELIKKKLETEPWKMASIKMYGPLIEVLVHFSNLFSKLDPTTRFEVTKFLWASHLPGQKMPPKTAGDYEEQNSVLPRGFGDFVLAHHLVPEQMIIYPIAALHQKNQLVFRYPGHKKKLLQYINSKASRLANNKLKKVHIHPMLKEFIDHYLKYSKENTKDIFIFSKKLPTSRPEDFIAELDDFLAKNPNTYKYPSDYI